jgi:hypothetical protein
MPLSIKATMNIGCSIYMRRANSALASVGLFVPTILSAYLIGGSCFPRSCRWRLHRSQPQLRMLSTAVLSRNLSSLFAGKKRFSSRTMAFRGIDRFASSCLARIHGKAIKSSTFAASTMIQFASWHCRSQQHRMCAQKVASATKMLINKHAAPSSSLICQICDTYLALMDTRPPKEATKSSQRGQQTVTAENQTATEKSHKPETLKVTIKRT